ncbi:MAG TPA: glucose 1-dehydrogenase [Phycisphaerae bacterium]|jgi:NAD(P)-dependent dehydrogenase (short-subunit alcohol dehydrogenase family)
MKKKSLARVVSGKKGLAEGGKRGRPPKGGTTSGPEGGITRAGRLAGKVALITGGDSGIGRAVALSFAREGADVGIGYLDEHDEALEVAGMVEGMGRKCVLLPGDIGSEDLCRGMVEKVVKELGRLNILVNNAGVQFPRKTIEEITEEDMERTFRTNVYGTIFLAKHAVKVMREGAAIVNMASITAYRGAGGLVDYSASKGAVVSFTRALSQQLLERNIRVNGVAPGPIWTPLIEMTFPDAKKETFGTGMPMKRAGTPEEVAACVLFLASDEASYLTGQILHPNGGVVVNG